MTHTVTTRARLAAAALLAAAAGAGAVALPAAAEASHVSRASHARTPACTRAALQAGLSRGPAALRHGAKVVRPYACDGGWATAGVITGGADGVEVTSVFRAQDGRWATVNRTRPCARREIPRRIRRAACDSN